MFVVNVNPSMHKLRSVNFFLKARTLISNKFSFYFWQKYHLHSLNLVYFIEQCFETLLIFKYLKLFFNS